MPTTSQDPDISDLDRGHESKVEKEAYEEAEEEEEEDEVEVKVIHLIP